MSEFIVYIDCPVCGEHVIRCGVKRTCPIPNCSEENNNDSDD